MVLHVRKPAGVVISIDSPENTMGPDLISNHPKRIYIRGFRWARAAFKQLWRHPSKRAYAGWRGDSHAQRMVTQHSCKPEVCDACRETAIDQNVALCAISRDRALEELNLRLSNLRGQTASHGDTSVRERHLPAAGVRSGWRLLQVFGNAHQFQSIGQRTCGDEVHDCPIFHPFRHHHQDVGGFGRSKQR